jgi:hypothetical protein
MTISVGTLGYYCLALFTHSGLVKPEVPVHVRDPSFADLFFNLNPFPFVSFP